MSYLLLPVVAAVISAIGQILLKYAMLKHGPIAPSLSGILALFFEPLLLVALSMYAVAMLLWLQVLSKVPLSVAYPILAITYAIVPVLAVIIKKKKIGHVHLLGIAFVLIGISLIGFNHE